MIVLGAPADPVARAAVAGPGAVAAFLEHKHQRAIGVAPVQSESVDLADCLDAETAGAPLISERTVDEAVGQHPAPALDCGNDGFLDMIGAGGGEQQRLCTSTPAVFVTAEKKLSNSLGTGTAARFTGDEHLDSAR